MLSVGLILKEYFFISILIPIALIITVLYLFALDKLILLIVFLTPLAINISNLEMGLGISLPTEPLLFGVLVLFIAKVLFSNYIDKRIIKHPVSVFVIINLIWIFFTSLTSEIPLVSFKFFLARLWFVIPMYFIGVMIFKKLGNVKLFIWLYAISLLGVIAYTLVNHAQYGFNEEAGHWVMTPFYNDHTAYGAILALFIPIFVGLSIDKSYSKTMRLASIAVLFILIVALIFSYIRAAWISLVLGLAVYIIIRLRIKFRWILLTFGILLNLFYL